MDICSLEIHSKSSATLTMVAMTVKHIALIRSQGSSLPLQRKICTQNLIVTRQKSKASWFLSLDAGSAAEEVQRGWKGSYAEVSELDSPVPRLGYSLPVAYSSEFHFCLCGTPVQWMDGCSVFQPCSNL